ncbi:K02A2.6-like, partial [Cordylochernes scorpioides]
MESDPDSENGENTTIPKKETTLGRTQEVPPQPRGRNAPAAGVRCPGEVDDDATSAFCRDRTIAKCGTTALRWFVRGAELLHQLRRPSRSGPTTILYKTEKASKPPASTPPSYQHASIQPPETFDFSTPNEWPKWRKRFERYLVVSGMKKKVEADKIDLFMYLMGDRADDIFRTFKFEKEEEATKIDSVLKAFDSHFCVRKNIIYERAKFNSRIQEDREPVDEFITSLYKLADSCEFEGLHEQLIRDRIVVGVRDKALSERMQLDSELTLEKAVKMVRQQEAVRQQQVDLQRPSTSQKVNQVKFNSKKQSPKQQQQPSRKKEKSAKTRSRCPKCGGFTHREGQACRAEGQKCNLCSKTGHFANCCPDKQAKTAEVKAVSELDEEIGFLLEVSAVEDSSNLDDDEGECRRRWTAEIQVNGKKVKFKLDSQADVTCVPLCLFKKIMGQQRLVESDINIRAAEFSELQTVGMFISTLRNGNYEIKEKIYVIRRLSEPLLSRRACELLNLARRIEVVATRINPIKEFPEVFEGLGQIGNPYEIKLKPGAKPYALHTPRRVPIPLMEKLKTRLEELEKAGIIAQVNVATEWCAPTVIAGKPNGDIRLCVDLSRLNEHVQREVHPMPVVEHMLGQLGEARFFSKLDANSGFHQIPLSPDCQHLTTFITPFGRYKYCRMPFGISLAPEYFQRVMSIILQGMDGVMCYLDDILIFASDSKTHDRILRLVLRKLKEANVTLNKAKCVFGVPRINFLGHILDEDGIRPDPAKIEAVAKMPAPTDVHGVRRFLGMVNHLGRFVENLSEIVAPLSQLLVKSQDFVWDCSQERAFRKLKELLTTQPILAAYDVRKPTMVSSDASSYGLGAVLKQEGKNGIWRPVAYSSRTMTPTEKRYAQIEKEALAITWACERFQDFLLGKRFRIETDHKPLIPLFSTKELSSLTPRLQRFRMRMMRFGFEIVHIPGKELLDADALSRQPLLTTEGGEDERPTSAHINAVLSCITDKDVMLTKIFEAQQEDTTLKAVVNYLEKGWPDKKKMSQALLSYWHVKDELGVQNGLLMRSCRLVIPASMKLEILEKLHAGHFGITKTRLRARETVWWPGISEEIAETVRKCSVCIQEAVSKHEPLIPTNFPSRPWQKIGMDLFKFENKWYLVVIDYYSRFPEMIQLDRLTASVVVRSCKSIFARHGIPETVVSDNGTQFGAAREFADFARQYGFTHVTSSPRFPQSNGMAEAGVKIAKLILKKNQDPSLGLLEYRSTPLENGYSPAELLMGRKLRTTLPIAPENLNPKLVDSQTLKRKEGRRRKDMKSRYDRRCGATDMEELSEGDTVWITDMRTWGIVKKKASTPRSYMVDTPVGTLRRNRFHLRKGVTVQYPADPSTPTFSGEELVENEKTPVVDFPSNDSEDGQIRTRNALEWFADEILSNASIKKWDTVKLKLIQRFGYKVESPIVAASKRRLKKEETVEDYFIDKIRLLNQTSLNNVEKLKMLTDGLPLDWKNYLVTAQPKDPSHWMQIAMEIEQNNNQIRQQQRSKTKVFNITTPTISKNCPYWCPICKKKGLYFKHWISDCKDYDPNYKDKLKHQATNITTDVKQTIADSLCIANTNFPYRFVNVEVLLNNIPVSSFIDTGYPLLIGLDVAGKIGLIIDTKDKAVYVKGNECFYISPETHLPSVQQKELNQLLKENQALFSQHETDIGRIAVQHKIHTIEHPPISCRPYRRPLAEYDEIKRQVEELSKKGLIRESQSPWAFPVVLVSKKDGSQRMCIDYRKLNAITIDDKQPLPYIQDMFDRLHNAKYFTTLDIAWGYWHVEMHPDSVEKTAFITNDGHYEFLVMPFGLKNAPSTFQRIIQHIIGNLLWNGVCNYQDDILIYSSTFKDHIELMKKIFDKLKENNIKLKLKKCSFAKQEIRYLGHIIGHNKIKPDPEKTKVINEFPQPKTVKQVRQFLGLAGYYRKFIPKFSEIADPLTSLTRKNKLFKWTTEVNKSFQELKSHLSTDPVLSTYDPSLPCKLYTDASKLGIGAILAQIGNDNQEHVISYYSGKLLPHQQNYSAFELECFAVVQSVEYFEVYLENNTFEVITDHSALEWLFNVKKPKAKYLRWIIELSTKSMKIVHRSGSKLTHVDALSRSPVSFHISIPTLRLHQQKADLSFVKNSHIHRDLIMVKHNGVLKTVVPESFQEEILKEYHDNHSHPSINKTVRLITPFYWWPNAIRCIKDYVRSCKICQITKCSHKPFIGEYVAPNSDLKPLELISMDTIVLGSAANETKHKYIQVIIDHLTRFVWAFPTVTNTSQAVIQCLDKINKTVPQIKCILTENGKNFTSKEFNKFLNEHQVQHTYSTPYHPQSNGLCEKMNDTILTKLRTNLQENPRLKWSSLLAKIVKDYNSTPHDVTGFSPNFLLFGDWAIPEFSESPHFTIENARKKAIENSAKHREKWKARHDAKHPQSSFKVGDLVLRKIASNDPSMVKTSP